MSLTTSRHQAPGCGHDPLVLVMLPGAKMVSEDYLSHGFLEVIRRRGWPIDVVLVETGLAGYLADDLAERLHQEVVSPLVAGGAKRVWLSGISVGGFGALRYVQRYPGMIEGLLLIAPFLGSGGLIAEIESVGGLAAWYPTAVAESSPQRQVFSWLKHYRAVDQSWPAIHLAYGETDRFAAAHRLLAKLLPRGRVTTMNGGHDWDTWEILWEKIVETEPFTQEAVLTNAPN